jgi:hypothetical protein
MSPKVSRTRFWCHLQCPEHASDVVTVMESSFKWVAVNSVWLGAIEFNFVADIISFGLSVC